MEPAPRLLALLYALGCAVVVGGGGVGGGLPAGGGGGLGAELVCGRGLTARQRALCRAAPAAVAALGNGLSMAYAECRAQLAGRRWNCSGVGDDARLGHVLPMGTKEAAFTYAITSAGVTHALGAACARGDLPSCSCGGGRRRTGTAEQWEWGGCGGSGAGGGEAAWGARFARRFLDARELEADARALMNLHNNRVGRKVVKEMVRRECKCHGVSGSCAVRTCWRALPAFPAVAAALRDRYRRAKLVAAVTRAHSAPPYAPPLTQPVAPTQGLLLRRGGGGTGRAPRRSELVYLQPSPSYCEPSVAAAAPGTRGRLCNPSPGREEDGCAHLCCGRGFRAERVERTARCRCRFHWCCRVTCDTCRDTSTVHVCN